jgi:hypothetical protein
MKWNRWLAGLAILVLGAGMAWDSGVFTAPPHVLVLVALAIVAPAIAALSSRSFRMNVGAVVLSTVLLIVARQSSDIQVRWYAMPFLFYMFFYMSWLYERWKLAAAGERM